MFMDHETYEHILIADEIVHDILPWLKPNTNVEAVISEGCIVPSLRRTRWI